MGMLEKVQALLTITGQAGGGGGGGDITVDSALSNTSTNPIQNQYLGKRMGATNTNSVQIGYNAKAGKTSGQAIDGIGGDNGRQVAVGGVANGSNYGAAVGYDTNGSNYGAAVGYNAKGQTDGAAVGYGANGYSYGAAVGYNADGSDNGAVLGSGANGSGYSIAIGANSTTKYETYTATIGVESSNDTQYSLQISAYNNEQNTFFVQRLVAGETLDTSYIDFYHRDRVSGELKGRRISATNFFKLLDAYGAIEISGGGDSSGDVSA